MYQYLFLISAISMMLISCERFSEYFKNINKDTNNGIDTVLYQTPTQITFKDTLLDLGTVKQGTQVPFSYYFTNTGQAPLIITDVTPGCGCTVAKYPKMPISPGVSDSITGSFNSEGRKGPYEKHIDVRCNSEIKKHKLIFKITVNDK